MVNKKTHPPEKSGGIFIRLNSLIFGNGENSGKQTAYEKASDTGYKLWAISYMSAILLATGVGNGINPNTFIGYALSGVQSERNRKQQKNGKTSKLEKKNGGDSVKKEIAEILNKLLNSQNFKKEIYKIASGKNNNTKINTIGFLIIYIMTTLLNEKDLENILGKGNSKAIIGKGESIKISFDVIIQKLFEEKNVSETDFSDFSKILQEKGVSKILKTKDKNIINILRTFRDGFENIEEKELKDVFDNIKLLIQKLIFFKGEIHELREETKNEVASII